MYTERLDVAIEEVEPVLRVLRKCRLKHMVACVLKERRTLRYYFKSTRKDEAGPRRYGHHACIACSCASALAKHALVRRSGQPGREHSGMFMQIVHCACAEAC